MQWKVSALESGQQLLPFLKSKLPESYSNRSIKQLLEKNACTLNGHVERFGSTVIAKGDLILLVHDISSISSKKVIVSILYQDDDFVFIDKPIGLASDDPRLLQMTSKATNTKTLQLLHRLDKGTSGVLAFAKYEEAGVAFENLFRERKVRKRYMAILSGVAKQMTGHIDNFLARLKSLPGQSLWGVVSSGDKGLHAVTDWRVIKRGKNCTLVECFPLTGRTHQIRVHMSMLGFPIVGDVQYGQKTHVYAVSRPLLHAAELAFEHPFTLKQTIVRAPLPNDFQNAMDCLGLA